MSFWDKAKEKAQTAAEKAKEQAEIAKEKSKEAAATAASKIQDGGYVDKYAAKIDEKTGGKYSDKIAKAASSAKEGVGKLAPTETVVSMEYSDTYGAEPTETAEEAASVFEDTPPAE